MPLPEQSREDEAKFFLENTEVAPAIAWALTLLFLLTIISVPLIQHVVEIRRNLSARAAEKQAGEAEQAPQSRLLPQSYDAFALLPSKEELRAARSPQAAWDLIPPPAEIKGYESTLEDESVVAQWLLPRTQTFLARNLGVGNEKAYIGQGGWLMYTPDVDYLTSPGFLDPALQRVRARSGDSTDAAVQPNPIKAIVHFKEQLAARGIQLIVMPMPVKPMIHAEKMAARYDWNHEILQNPSYEKFRRELQSSNVLLFDISQTLIEAKQKNKAPQFLKTDTHWTPEAMQLCAHQLAKLIRQQKILPPHQNENYKRGTRAISNLGDIAEMLKLPQQQTLYNKQTVTIHPIKTPDGEPLYSTRDADILLLGDSFCNVYSFAEMGWGEAAGFGEQLSYELQRPHDAIINNAGGSHVTRQQLVRDLRRGKNRLRGKRLVIWEFSMRDLLSGDWKILDLPETSS